MVKSLTKRIVSAFLAVFILLSSIIIANANTEAAPALRLLVKYDDKNPSSNKVLLELYAVNASKLTAANIEISYSTSHYKYISSTADKSLDGEDFYIACGKAFDQDGILTAALSARGNGITKSPALIASYNLERTGKNHADFKLKTTFLQGLPTIKANTFYPGDIIDGWHVIKRSTCKEPGERVRYCEGEICERAILPATGFHSYGLWKIVRVATPTQEGLRERQCSVCGEVVSEKIKIATDKITIEPNDNAKIISDENLGQVLYISTASNVSDIISLAQGSGVAIKDKDGKNLADGALVGTGSYITQNNISYLIIVRNDANGDGKITASDARITLRISAKLEGPQNWHTLALDANSDQKITASDARKILRISAKLES